MSRVHPPGSPCGSPFSTPFAANTVGGAQVLSDGAMYLLIENGELEVKWLSKATPLGVVPEQRGRRSPGCVVPSSQVTVVVVVTRLTSFCSMQPIGEPD